MNKKVKRVTLLLIIFFASLLLNIFHLAKQNEKLQAELRSHQKESEEILATFPNKEVIISETKDGFRHFAHGYYGYFFEIPSFWKITQIKKRILPKNKNPATSNQIISLKASDNELVQIYVHENIEELGLMDWCLKYYSGFLSSHSPGIPDQPNALIAGEKAVLVIDPTYDSPNWPPVFSVILENQGVIYTVKYSAFKSGSGIDDYVHILKSFGFKSDKVDMLDDSMPTINPKNLFWKYQTLY